jgi:hypothetical protein
VPRKAFGDELGALPQTPGSGQTVKAGAPVQCAGAEEDLVTQQHKI